MPSSPPRPSTALRLSPAAAPHPHRPSRGGGGRRRLSWFSRIGVVRGVLEAAQFPAEVSAHDNEEGATVLLIKFAPEVLEREKRQA